MQVNVNRFRKNDLARYPFLKETSQYVKKLDFRIEDIASPELAKVLERAEERLQEAILYTMVSRKMHNEDIEILSFPVAIMLAVATGNSFVQKRYALAEAKQAFEELKTESKERMLAIAHNFDWKIQLNGETENPFEFAVHFTNYVRNLAHLRDSKWKLVNRPLVDGKVLLSRNETARLLSEEVRKYIEQRVSIKETKFPAQIENAAERIKKLSAERVSETETEGIPKNVENGAFPPCIQVLYQTFTSGRHLSHVGRFTLTTFLVNAGMPVESVVDLFKNFSDFNQRMTRYQVEHIAGETGSRTKYKPPKCETLLTHGICINSDELCRKIHHPLSYYVISSKNKKTSA
jgi:DNA primase large subunit